jgi:5-deoxy-glucuronate isomerase
MTSPLLAKARREGREIVDVTPERAGWTHVGFRALRLKAGESESFDTGARELCRTIRSRPLSGAARELCLVVLAGKVDVQAADQSFADLGTRTHVFDDRAPDAVYVPPQQRVAITATRDAEVALCTAPGDTTPRAIKRLDPASMRRSVRGQGSNTRTICDVLPHDDPSAAHLLVVEVRTPAGHSSSYPPHKHDSETPPTETQLEETYYHRLNPPQGFAFQRVYTDDRSLDESMAVEDHDVVMVPRGYHPVVVPHGYDSYYLNVMAGPRRLWVFRNDPAHEWMLQC